MQALEAAQKQALQATEAAQQAWQEQRAALEKQHLQALLRSKQVQEQERQQWQKERDALVQQLTAQHTTLEMQVGCLGSHWAQQCCSLLRPCSAWHCAYANEPLDRPPIPPSCLPAPWA